MTHATTKILPHGGLEEIVPDVWTVTGQLSIPLRRNMTVLRLGDGSLLLHSGVAMNDAGMAALEALGRPAVCVVPANCHRMDAAFYKARYPQMKVVAPAGARADVEKVVGVDATAEELLPELGVKVHPVPSLKDCEAVYEIGVAGGKLLVFCDFVANADYPAGLGGAFFRNVLGGISGRLGTPRIVQLTGMRDRRVAREQLLALAETPDLLAITVAHGRSILEDCAGALREAAASLGS